MMKRPAAMMKRPAAMMKRPAAADRVADTAPDWLVEPDPTAQLYVFWNTAAKHLPQDWQFLLHVSSRDRNMTLANINIAIKWEPPPAILN